MQAGRGRRRDESRCEAAGRERGLVTELSGERVEAQGNFVWVVDRKGMVEGATIHMDGSMFNGFGEKFAVFGWAYAIVKGGEVVGLARGVPPRHVKSTPATEAWALTMAFDRVEMETAQFHTDGRSVRDLARAGLKEGDGCETAERENMEHAIRAHRW